MARPSKRYKVERTPVFVENATVLFAHAHAAGRQDELRDTLARVVEQLEKDPIRFGDPQHHTALKGGKVYQRMLSNLPLLPNLVIRYAVFKRHRLVFLMSVRCQNATWN